MTDEQIETLLHEAGRTVESNQRLLQSTQAQISHLDVVAAVVRNAEYPRIEIKIRAAGNKFTYNMIEPVKIGPILHAERKLHVETGHKLEVFIKTDQKLIEMLKEEKEARDVPEVNN